MLNKKGLYVIFIIAFAFLTTSLHFLIFRSQSPHVILEELFYIPLFLATAIFGLKGGLLTYVFVSALYVPFFFGPWSRTTFELTDRLLHLLFTGLFVFLTGVFVDRERRRRRQLERDRYLAGIGEAAATIAHDLKNPLIVILAFARRIKDGKSNVESAMPPIIESAEKMQKMMDGMMDFARPLQLNLTKGDLRDVIQQVCRSCQVKAEEKEVALSMHVPSEPICLAMDSLSLERAFTNLIHNSIDSSGKGKSVIISLAKRKKCVEAKIKDFGSGMDKETLENLFIPFYSKKKGGTGLGMPIVKKVIEGHQGKIRIHSQPGLGTEVIVTLPYRNPNSPALKDKLE